MNNCIEKNHFMFSNQYLLLLSLLTLSGCASIAPGSSVDQLFEREGVSTLLIPAEYREVYFSPASSNETHCRAPSPDFTVQASDGLDLGVSGAVPGVEEKVAAKEGQAALSLGGRSADVLITRELMYRACELASNTNADKKTTIEIYMRFLDSIERIAKVQKEIGTKSSSDKVNVTLPPINLHPDSYVNQHSSNLSSGKSSSKLTHKLTPSSTDTTSGNSTTGRSQ